MRSNIQTIFEPALLPFRVTTCFFIYTRRVVHVSTLGRGRIEGGIKTNGGCEALALISVCLEGGRSGVRLR